MIVIPLILVLQAAPATDPSLSLEQSTALRCSAAFALTAEAQARGDADAASLPPLAGRGREYFVRVSAKLMDELELDRPRLSSLLRGHAVALVESKDATAVARACLPMLDAAGL
jgi:hypothetical protein